MRSRRWPSLVRALVVLVVFGFIVSVLVRDLGDVRGRLHDARPGLLFAALVTYVAFLLGQAFLWHLVTVANQASQHGAVLPLFKSTFAYPIVSARNHF
jgi:hypothetical protein